MNTDELIEYYADLLIIQYRALPKARGTIKAFASEVIADQLANKVKNAFNLETATGNQLDFIGKYVGVERNIVGLELSKSYIAMPAYDDGSASSYAGFPIYGDTVTTFFMNYADTTRSLFKMSDYDMRRLIKLKIYQQNSDNTLKDIDDIIYETFGADCAVTDGKDMTLTYAFTPGLLDLLPKLAVYTKSLPAPGGLTITVTGVTI